MPYDSDYMIGPQCVTMRFYQVKRSSGRPSRTNDKQSKYVFLEMLAKCKEMYGPHIMDVLLNIFIWSTAGSDMLVAC